MRDGDFQRLLFDYSRRCRERGVDAPYDFVVQEHGPRSIYCGSRPGQARAAVASSSPVPGSSPLRAVGSRVASSTAMWLFSRLGGRGDATLLEPMGNRRQSAIMTVAKLPMATAARTVAFSPRSATKDEATRRTSTSCLGRGSLVSAMCAGTRSVASGDSRSDSSAQGCEELGIRYEPFPELGIASKHRAGLADRASYDRLFARYEATTLPRCRDAVVRIAGWVDAGERVAITCYERDSRDCHRSRLASAIVKTYGPSPCCRDTCRIRQRYDALREMLSEEVRLRIAIYHHSVQTLPPRRRAAAGPTGYTRALEAATVGQGVVLGWRYLIERSIEAGTLVALGDGFVETGNVYYRVLTEEGRRKLLAHECLALLNRLR